MERIVCPIQEETRSCEGWGETFTETLSCPIGPPADASQSAGEGDGGSAFATPISPAAFQGLDKVFLQVRSMMAFFGQEFPDRPTLLTPELVKRRAKWVRSECDELEDPANQTIRDQCDAFLDMIVFAVGGLVELGVLPQQMLDYVIDSQFGKVHMVDGVSTIVKNEDGKVVKPANWETDHAPEPKMQAEIERQEAAGLLQQIDA
jgi:predicted HAD superfamily Cof-like phosphohydrolase